MRKVLTSGSFIRLSLQNFFFFCAMNLMNVLPDYLVSLGASKSYVGLFMNLNSLVLVFLVVPLSHFTDRIGRKRLLVLGHMGFIIALGLSFFFHSDPLLLGVFRLLGTLSFCAAFTIHGVEIFEIIPVDRRVAGVAFFGISGLLSNPVSSLGGEFLFKNFQASGVFAGSFFLMVPVLVLALTQKWHKPHHDQHSGGRKFIQILTDKKMLPLIAMTLIFGGAFSVFSTFLANHTRATLHEILISPFFTAFTVVGVSSRIFFSKVLDRVSKRALVALCFGSVTIALVLTFFLQYPWVVVLVLAGLFYGLGHSVLFPVFSTLFVQSGSDGERLALSNLFSSVNTLGNFLFALCLGFLGDWLGTPWIFAAMALFTLLAIPLARLYLGKKGPIRDGA